MFQVSQVGCEIDEPPLSKWLVTRCVLSNCECCSLKRPLVQRIRCVKNLWINCKICNSTYNNNVEIIDLLIYCSREILRVHCQCEWICSYICSQNLRCNNWNCWIISWKANVSSYWRQGCCNGTHNCRMGYLNICFNDNSLRLSHSTWHGYSHV